MFKKKTAPSSLRARPPPKVSTTNDEDDTEDTHVFSTLTIGGAKKKQNAIQSTASIRANRAKIIPHEVIDIDIDEPGSIPTETQEPKKPQGKSLTDLYYTPHSSDEEVEIVAKKHIKNISSVPEDDYIEDKSRYVGINQNTYTKQPDYIALEQTNQSKPNQNDYMLNYQDQIYSETFYTSSRTKKDMIQKQIDLTEQEEHNIDEEDDDDEMDSWVAQKMRAGGGKDIAANHLTAQRATRKKLKIPPTTIKIPQLDQYMKKLSTQLDKLEIEQSATVQDLEIEKKNSSHKRDQIKLHSTDVEHDGREAAFFQELGQWITEYAFFMEEKVPALEKLELECYENLRAAAFAYRKSKSIYLAYAFHTYIHDPANDLSNPAPPIEETWPRFTPPSKPAWQPTAIDTTTFFNDTNILFSEVSSVLSMFDRWRKESLQSYKAAYGSLSVVSPLELFIRIDLLNSRWYDTEWYQAVQQYIQQSPCEVEDNEILCHVVCKYIIPHFIRQGFQFSDKSGVGMLPDVTQIQHIHAILQHNLEDSIESRDSWANLCRWIEGNLLEEGRWLLSVSVWWQSSSRLVFPCIEKLPLEHFLGFWTLGLQYFKQSFDHHEYLAVEFLIRYILIGVLIPYFDRVINLMRWLCPQLPDLKELLSVIPRTILSTAASEPQWIRFTSEHALQGSIQPELS